MIELLPLISYCFVMSATPGPNNVMLAITGANFGGRGALPVILGIQSGLFVQTLLMCVGLGSVFTAYPQAQHVLRVTGALYLMFLAWKLCRTPSGTAKAATAVSFTQAAIFQALNPKSWLRSVTVASVFMPAEHSTASHALLVSLVGAMIGVPCNAMWAMFGMSIRRILHDPAKQRLFNWTMGATLLALALMFLR